MTSTSFLRRNGLSVALLLCLLGSLLGQILTGYQVDCNARREQGRAQISLSHYVRSPHFVSATFENWESEFLQMGMYVLLTVWLRQRGSAESKPLEDPAGDEDERPKVDGPTPWPVRRGGIWRAVYGQSLAIAFFALFIASFVLHLTGSWRDYCSEAMAKHQPAPSLATYAFGSDFWFQSFQNWQSEFLAVLALVLLTIWLRQDGSPQSKCIDAPHSQTGT